MSFTPLIFLRTCPPYNTGEIAGFSKEEAGKLLSKGVAALYNVGEPGEVFQDIPQEERNLVPMEELPVKTDEPAVAVDETEETYLESVEEPEEDEEIIKK